MSYLSEHLAKLKSPTSTPPKLLAYMHSGQVLTQSLPRLLRILMVVWLFVYALTWILLWPTVYEEFERWGLVKAFVVQMISLTSILIVISITLLRARHLQALPGDDFVVLRAMAVLWRWLGEITLIYVLGMGLSTVLQPVGPLMLSLLGSPAEGGSGRAALDFASGSVSWLTILLGISLFLFSYSVAGAIDVSLTIEFNTRVDRISKGMLKVLEPNLDRR